MLLPLICGAKGFGLAPSNAKKKKTSNLDERSKESMYLMLNDCLVEITDDPYEFPVDSDEDVPVVISPLLFEENG